MARDGRNKEPTAGIVPVGWHHRFVGIPFADRGRDFSGCDCWGLVYLAYRQLLGIELPTYGEISAKDLLRVARNIGTQYKCEPWVEPRAPRPLDVAVMHFHGSKLVGHVGLLVEGAQVLHTERSHDSALVPLSHMTVRHRIVAFRRYRG